jgi:uncharacterized surface anchored protein
MNNPALLNRRELLGTIAAGCAVGVAGCVGDLGNGEDGDDADAASVTATVWDFDHDAEETNDPIEGATVTIEGEDVSEEAETDEEGIASFDGLDEGRYDISACADGYECDEDSFELDLELTDQYNAELLLESES